jgi:hypothetical protein
MGAIFYFYLAHDAPGRGGATAVKIDKGFQFFASLVALSFFMARSTEADVRCFRA